MGKYLKISDLINKLQEFQQSNGDIHVRVGDDCGNLQFIDDMVWSFVVNETVPVFEIKNNAFVKSGTTQTLDIQT